MKMTPNEHTGNALDWIGTSLANGAVLTAGTVVNRIELKGQFAYTIADDDDIEAIAQEIERICSTEV